MMLLEGFTDQQTHEQVTMTHDITYANGRQDEHVLRFFQPEPDAGEFAGTLLASYVLTPAQARELKASL